MKIPSKLLVSMREEAPVARSGFTLRDFIEDESGRGLTSFGLFFAGVMLVLGIGYGIMAASNPFFFGCNSCGKG